MSIFKSQFNFKKSIKTEDGMKVATGDEFFGNQEKTLPNIRVVKTKAKDLQREMNEKWRGEQILFEKNRHRNITDYQDSKPDRERIHNISSRGLIFTEKQLEIDDRVTLDMMLREQKMIYGRTQE